jgi:hypothetical protein
VIEVGAAIAQRPVTDVPDAMWHWTAVSMPQRIDVAGGRASMWVRSSSSIRSSRRVDVAL